MPLNKVLLIRHAEKPDRVHNILGVDINGHENSAELSVTGWQRAASLPRLFSPAQAAEMLPQPDVIFAAASHAVSARPVRTVQLLAQTRRLTIRDEFESDDIDALVHAVQASDRVALVCWRHERMAAIVRAFVGEREEVPEWDAQRFDIVWVLTATGDRWTFRQRPQLLLPDDKRELIK